MSSKHSRPRKSIALLSGLREGEPMSCHVIAALQSPSAGMAITTPLTAHSSLLAASETAVASAGVASLSAGAAIGASWTAFRWVNGVSWRCHWNPVLQRVSPQINPNHARSLLRGIPPLRPAARRRSASLAAPLRGLGSSQNKFVSAAKSAAQTSSGPDQESTPWHLGAWAHFAY
jgi:hypothetical protein